ncbi:MAG: sterol desaturase family protein [Alphaproteobacteria bacterium]|nr:sterol desaturase family protein [Alphaproteobacteria bacterium]
METFLIANEPILRLSAYLGLLAAFAGLESAFPRRSRARGRGRRWFANLAMGAAGAGLVRLLAFIAAPLVAVGAAVLAEGRGIGLLHAAELPRWAALAIGVLALDLLVYSQHVALHRIAPLWRLHRPHHTDLDVDVTTALRFHPAEIALSMGLKVLAVLALGIPPAAVVIFEVVLNGMAMFNHANLALPRPVDAALRLVLVTPDMHRVHHSRIPVETNANFGFYLSLWDRLFGTYVAEPSLGHGGMRVGLDGFDGPEAQSLAGLLVLPIRADGPAA